jgi:uncharacterized protein DUF3558
MRLNLSPARLNFPVFAAACLLALTSCQAATTQSANTANNSAAQQTASAPTPAAPASPASSPAPKASDPCALLTADDIKSVQGEPATQIKPSRREGAEFAVSQCFYQTPTFTKSVSLELTERGASQRDVREMWKELFARYEEKREAKNARRAKSGKPQAGPPATPIKGVGEEAYWIGTNANGTIYAFKKDRLVRISIGGPDKEADRLRKVKALAQKALARL